MYEADEWHFNRAKWTRGFGGGGDDVQEFINYDVRTWRACLSAVPRDVALERGTRRRLFLWVTGSVPVSYRIIL